MMKERSKIFKNPFQLLAVLAVLISGFIANGDAHGAGLLIAENGFGGVLEIVDHDVKVTINNGIAVTEVTQVFHNTEKRQVEALYTFPVPKGASVANFSMWINGKEMIGEVLEKQRAREIYNSYKQKRRDPGLLEQKDYKTFEMRIFPIAPEANQKVSITYYQELNFDHDWATYVYPLATTADSSADRRVHGRFSVNLDIKSVVPIATVESPSHSSDFLMVDHSELYREASLEKRDGDLARDVVLAFKVSRPVTGLDLITSSTKEDDGYFALTLRAGSELEKVQTGSDYVFILDISGSMANQGKLSSSVNSLATFIKALGPEDRFEVITFNRIPVSLFDKLAEAQTDNFSAAETFLASQEAKGGTALEPALSAAYRYATPDRTLNTVVLSDGMTEQAERRILMEMIKARPANVRVFCIGVGNEINRSLLKQLAEDAGGLAAFLSQGDDFRRQAQAFVRKLMHPVATNLAINISGLDTYDIEPERLPNLYYGMPITVYGRYKGAGTAQIELKADVNGRPITSTIELAFPEEDANNPEIERMWAWHRMEQLQGKNDTIRDQKLIDEIVRLGEEYSITSEYTSFLVLENDAEYKRWKIKRRNAVRTGRDRASLSKLRQQFTSLRNTSLDKIGPVEDKQISAKDPQAPNPVNQPPQWQPQQSNQPLRPSRSVDLPHLGGGGAIDPLSALIGIALFGGAFCGRKRKK